ncbi:MAG: P-loop NTPase [Caldimicrobium thiodismutans]
MIIAVASGKGGTGKTTIAVNLALSLENVQLVDCDVEEPNVHIFLNPEIFEIHSVKTVIPQIDKEKCTYCRKCSEICVYNALSVIKLGNYEKPHGEVIFFPHLCHGCEGCILLCPEKAINRGEREVGIVKIGKKENVRFIEGRLNISEILAPTVIEMAKSFINKNIPAIIDAPPGTSCSVVASLKDANFCILVTEPTPFGLHDLEIAYEVTKVLKIPSGVVINKSEDDTLIENFCQKNNIPILMKIPFDKKIAEVYSKGWALIEAFPEYKEKFLELFKKIKELQK